jgi:hypothetical protein
VERGCHETAVRRLVGPLALSAVVFLILSAGGSLLQPAEAAISCGDTVGPGTVALTADLGPCDDTTGPVALTVNGGTKLDLNGHKVFCQDTNANGVVPDGIQLNGSGSQLSHGTVDGCNSGVVVAGIGGHSVKTITSQNNTIDGFLVSSNYNSLDSNIAKKNPGGPGFTVDGDNNELSHNTVGEKNQEGIEVSGSYNQFAENQVTANAGDGIAVKGLHNLFKHNESYKNNGDGFEVSGSYNGFDSNTSRNNNPGDGFEISGSYNQVSKNKANNNCCSSINDADAAGDGFEAANGANNNAFSENKATYNDGAGFQVDGANSNQYESNEAWYNHGDGFQVDGNTNQFERNTSKANDLDGFSLEAEENTVDQNAVQDNALNGIHCNLDGTDNIITANKAINNNKSGGAFDLLDENSNCDNNTWQKNTFGTRSQSCIN